MNLGIYGGYCRVASNKPIPRCLLNLVMTLLIQGMNLQAISKFLQDLVAVANVLLLSLVLDLSKYDILNKVLQATIDILDATVTQIKNQLTNTKLDALRSCSVIEKTFTMVNSKYIDLQAKLDGYKNQLALSNLLMGGKKNSQDGIRMVIDGLTSLSNTIDLFVQQYPDMVTNSQWVQDNFPTFAQELLI